VVHAHNHGARKYGATFPAIVLISFFDSLSWQNAFQDSRGRRFGFVTALKKFGGWFGER